MKGTKALKIIKDLFERSENVWVIHYACSSLNKDPGMTRIASIVLRQLRHNQVKSFSLTNQENDEDKEKKILKNFFHYIASNSTAKYLHWNMHSNSYGFSAIEKRFKELFPGEELPFSIPDDNKYNLSANLMKIYGKYYITRDRLRNLMIKNDLLDHKSFLSAKEEALAFDHKEFDKIAASTQHKVKALADIADLCYRGKLKINNRISNFVIYLIAFIAKIFLEFI